MANLALATVDAVPVEAAPHHAPMALAPRSVDELLRISHIVKASGLYGVGSIEEAFVRIATGTELGLTVMQSLRGVHVINKRPTLAADLMVGVCKRRSDICKYFRLVDSTDQAAEYETERVGEGVTRMRYTIEQARRAKLTGKDTWTGHTEAMLRARASSLLARAVYSDILNGLYTPDEAEDIEARAATAAAAPRLAAAPADAGDAWEPPADDGAELLDEANALIDSLGDLAARDRLRGKLNAADGRAEIEAALAGALVTVCQGRIAELPEARRVAATEALNKAATVPALRKMLDMLDRAVTAEKAKAKQLAAAAAHPTVAAAVETLGAKIVAAEGMVAS